MDIKTFELILKTKGNTDIINISGQVSSHLDKSKFKEGFCNISVVGSTAGITTIEFENGLLKDLPEMFDKIIPQHKQYAHNAAWGDGNGHSHLRSALIKTTLTIPFINSQLILGTWQQIVLIDFDNRPRTRRIIVQFTGK